MAFYITAMKQRYIMRTAGTNEVKTQKEMEEMCHNTKKIAHMYSGSPPCGPP